jgi:hypothetical protein
LTKRKNGKKEKAQLPGGVAGPARRNGINRYVKVKSGERRVPIERIL